MSKARGPKPKRWRSSRPLADILGGYFYFFGTRGALLLQLGRGSEAKRRPSTRAISLANTAAEAAHIRGQIDRPDLLDANAGPIHLQPVGDTNGHP